MLLLAGSGGFDVENSSCLAIEINMIAGIPHGKNVMVPAIAPAKAITHRFLFKAKMPPAMASAPKSARNTPITTYIMIMINMNSRGYAGNIVLLNMLLTIKTAKNAQPNPKTPNAPEIIDKIPATIDLFVIAYLLSYSHSHCIKKNTANHSCDYSNNANDNGQWLKINHLVYTMHYQLPSSDTNPVRGDTPNKACPFITC
jgi:hypothetical protein